VRRLTDKSQFDTVYRHGVRSADAMFLVVAQRNELGHARLGLSVGVRTAGSAVKRNRLKRLIRESFRHAASELPPVDLVVNARPAAASAERGALGASLSRHWRRVGEKCAQS
jgi:ribonuclease P protein component